MFLVLTVRRAPMLVAHILALHELRAVHSWRLAFQAIGPPDRITLAPLMLQNLKRGSWMPSQTALPSCDPQHALLYVVRQWCWAVEEGMASVYASVLEEAGKTY